MGDVDVAAVNALPELAQRGAPLALARSARREAWISFAAAVALMLVIASLLLAATVELRGGWVANHELSMDKAAAIHRIFFRE